MYHQVTAYNHIIAYAQLALVIINVKTMINYPADRELRHSKSYFNIMSSEIHTIGCAIL